MDTRNWVRAESNSLSSRIRDIAGDCTQIFARGAADGLCAAVSPWGMQVIGTPGFLGVRPERHQGMILPGFEFREHRCSSVEKDGESIDSPD